MTGLLSYDTLRVIWWLLIGIVLVGFAATDGFDMGACTLLPFVAKSDTDRRVVINTVGPIWEGNQVWLILAGGAIFAAWPPLYAVSFSGFYLPLFLVLLALIIRAAAFKYRSKRPGAAWRNTWDWGLFVGGFVPALVFGVAIGNVIQGLPFRLEPDMQIHYDGSFFALFDPFSLLAGVLSLAMLTAHGAAWLGVKTEGEVQKNARQWGVRCALASAALFVVAGIYMLLFIKGYRITDGVIDNGPSNPLYKTVERDGMAWFTNYKYVVTLLVPILGIVGFLLCAKLLQAGRDLLALIACGLGHAGVILSVGVSMFPMVIPSSIQPNASLTVWDASSSHTTLAIMLLVTLIFLPIVLAYTSWVYAVMRGKVRGADIESGKGHAY